MAIAMAALVYALNDEPGTWGGWERATFDPARVEVSAPVNREAWALPEKERHGDPLSERCYRRRGKEIEVRLLCE